MTATRREPFVTAAPGEDLHASEEKISKMFFSVGVEQVVFCEVDLILAMCLTRVLKSAFGRLDIIHQLRVSPDETKLQLLRRTVRPVVLTCWSADDTIEAVKAYTASMAWSTDQVRVYTLGRRLL